MKILEKLFLFVRGLFHKDEIKKLDKANNPNIGDNFKQSLKVNTVKKKNSKIETLICEGDGLGIQEKISY